MGILITQRNEKWILGLREDWLLIKKDEILELSEFLLKCKINFKTKSFKDYCMISFENEEYETEDVNDFRFTLLELLKYKEKYGKTFNKDKRVKDKENQRELTALFG